LEETFTCLESVAIGPNRGEQAAVLGFYQQPKQAGRYFLYFGEITIEISIAFYGKCFAESTPPHQ